MKTLDQLNEHSTLADFIEFFEGIPEERWIIKEYTIDDGEHCCAYGHCGCREGHSTMVSRYLSKLVVEFCKAQSKQLYNIASVNDGDVTDYQQLTPKQRVLAYLKDLTSSAGK